MAAPNLRRVIETATIQPLPMPVWSCRACTTLADPRADAATWVRRGFAGLGMLISAKVPPPRSDPCVPERARSCSRAPRTVPG